VTSVKDLVDPETRQRLEDRGRELELAKLDRLMRQPGLLASQDEAPALHVMARDAERVASP
jgi:hypothetical protein